MTIRHRTWTRWMRHRWLNAAVALAISPGLAVPSAYAFGEAGHVRGEAAQSWGVGAAVSARLLWENLFGDYTVPEAVFKVQEEHFIPVYWQEDPATRLKLLMAVELYLSQLWREAAGEAQWEKAQRRDPALSQRSQEFQEKATQHFGWTQWSLLPEREQQAILKQAAEDSKIKLVWVDPGAESAEEAEQGFNAAQEQFDRFVQDELFLKERVPPVQKLNRSWFARNAKHQMAFLFGTDRAAHNRQLATQGLPSLVEETGPTAQTLFDSLSAPPGPALPQQQPYQQQQSNAGGERSPTPAPVEPSDPAVLAQRAQELAEIRRTPEGPAVDEAMYRFATQPPSPEHTVSVQTWGELLPPFYDAGLSDEYIPPIVLVDGQGNPDGLVRDGDVVVYWDFRADRSAPLAGALLDVPYEGQDGGLSAQAAAVRPSIHLVTMASYAESLTGEHLPPDRRAHEAFQLAPLTDTYSEVVARAGIRQLRVAETQKWRAITQFLDGLRNLGYEARGFDTVLGSDASVAVQRHPTLPITVKVVESRQVASDAEAPQMRTAENGEVAKEGIESGDYEDIVVNFAAPDMPAHQATRPDLFGKVVEGVLEVDRVLGSLVQTALQNGVTVLITADHGNAETMKTPDGRPNPSHTTNPVPFIILGLGPDEQVTIRRDATIGDLGPTKLHLRGMEPPASWDRTSALVGTVHGRRDRKILTIILDGWGLSDHEDGNAMKAASRQKSERGLSPLQIDRWMAGEDGAVAAAVEASGEDLGYPNGVAGSTEMGHVLFDAGRRFDSIQTIINRAMEDGTFDTNPVLVEAIQKAKASGAQFHLWGVLSDGKMHASLDHVEALLRLAAKAGLAPEQVVFHPFLDGRDVDGQSAAQYLAWLQGKIAEYGVGRIVSIMGRVWPKDRNNSWGRLGAAFLSLVQGTAALHVRFPSSTAPAGPGGPQGTDARPQGTAGSPLAVFRVFVQAQAEAGEKQYPGLTPQNIVGQLPRIRRGGVEKPLEVSTIEPDLRALVRWGLISPLKPGDLVFYQLTTAARVAAAKVEPVLERSTRPGMRVPEQEEVAQEVAPAIWLALLHSVTETWVDGQSHRRLRVREGQHEHLEAALEAITQGKERSKTEEAIASAQWLLDELEPQLQDSATLPLYRAPPRMLADALASLAREQTRQHVQDLLRQSGTMAEATIARRLAAWRTLNPFIFRKYDIRGNAQIVDPEEAAKGTTPDLTPEVAFWIGWAFGSLLPEGAVVTLGRDMRETGPALAEAFVEGVALAGVNVNDVDVISTGMMKWAYVDADAVAKVRHGGHAAIVSGSHSAIWPKMVHGFKLGVNGRPFVDEQIQELLDVIQAGRFRLAAERGAWQLGAGRRFIGRYQDMARSHVQHELARRGVADLSTLPARILYGVSPLVTQPGIPIELLREFGAHVERFDMKRELVDPNEPGTAAELVEEIQRRNANLQPGEPPWIAFYHDPDADRFGVVDANGRVLTGDDLVLFFITDVFERYPDEKVVVLDERLLEERSRKLVRKLGGTVIDAPGGYPGIIRLMEQHRAHLGAEATTHLMIDSVPDAPYRGIDDGFMNVLHLAVILAHAKQRPEEFLAALERQHELPPISYSEPGIAVPDAVKWLVVERVARQLKERYQNDSVREIVKTSEVDGFKVHHTQEQWTMQARVSHTSPKITFPLAVLVGQEDRMRRHAIELGQMVREEALALRTEAAVQFEDAALGTVDLSHLPSGGTATARRTLPPVAPAGSVPGGGVVPSDLEKPALDGETGLLFWPAHDFVHGKLLDPTIIQTERTADEVRVLLQQARQNNTTLSITGHLRGFDGPGSSQDLPRFQLALTPPGPVSLEVLPSTPTIASAFTTRVRFEFADDPEVIEYVAPDYGISADRPDQVYGPVQLDPTGRAPRDQLDAAAFIFHLFGLRGVRIVLEEISPMGLAGGMESSNVFNVALIAAASMLSGANLSWAEVYNLAVALENKVLGGLTGGQGHLSTILGGAYRHVWLSGVTDTAGHYINPYAAFSVPLLPTERLPQIEEHMMYVQAGKGYADGEPLIKRTAALINDMWTDLLQDQDPIALPLYQEMPGLTARYTKALQDGNYQTVVETVNRFVDIRDVITRRWVELALDAQQGVEAPPYAREYARRVFDRAHPAFADYQLIRDLYAQHQDAIRNMSLYTLDPIAELIQEARAENIAIMPLGAGGPGAVLMAISPHGQQHLKAFFDDERGLPELTEGGARAVIRGTGMLRGYMPFHVGREPIQITGFEALGLTPPQAPHQGSSPTPTQLDAPPSTPAAPAFGLDGISTLDDVDVAGKTVLVRSDLNVPVTNGRIDVEHPDDRFIESARTLQELAQKGAGKIIVIFHQGRPGVDDPDFLDAPTQHAEALRQVLQRPVKAVDDLFGEAAVEAIRGVQPGEILLLKPARAVDPKTERTLEADPRFVQTLEPLIDLFVLDALSIAHRNDPSVTGFTKTPAVAGRLMMEELRGAALLRTPPSPHLVIVGGAKIPEKYEELKSALTSGRAAKIFVGGRLAHLALVARQPAALTATSPEAQYQLAVSTLGHTTANDLREDPERPLDKLPEMARLLAQHSETVELPTDMIVLIEGGNRREVHLSGGRVPEGFDGLLSGIGPATAQRYADIIAAGYQGQPFRSAFVVGPLTDTRDKALLPENRVVLEAISKAPLAWWATGGGDTNALVRTLGLTPTYRFLSGGALAEFRAGHELPGISFLASHRPGQPPAAPAGPAQGSRLEAQGNDAVAPNLEPRTSSDLSSRCVTGDSLLAIAVEDAQGSGLRAVGIPIKDVKAGMRVYSLNEATGTLEPRRITGLLVMGVKPVWRLTTSSGKRIRTTANHPYLVWRHGSRWRGEEQIAEAARSNAVISGGGDARDTARSQTRAQHRGPAPTSLSARTSQSSFFSGQSDNVVPTNSNAVAVTRNQIFHAHDSSFPQKPPNIPAMAKAWNSVRKVLASASRRLLVQNTFAITTPVSHVDNDPSNHPHLVRVDGYGAKGMDSPSFSADVHHRVSIGQGPAGVNPAADNNPASAVFSPQEGRWTQVIALTVGQSIAVAGDHGEPTWERVEAIDEVGDEAVYDIEVDGTHNFLANGIIAHNTAIGSEGVSPQPPTPSPQRSSVVDPVEEFLSSIEGVAARDNKGSPPPVSLPRPTGSDGRLPPESAYTERTRDVLAAYRKAGV